MRRTIVISAVNLVDAGPLTVLQECLGYLSDHLSDEYEIIALVNRKELAFFKNIKYLEFPRSKKAWINRLYYEYYYFGKLAKQLKPFLWLSLHDMTPNVKVERLAVYCHNASPFYNLSFKAAMMDPKFALFNLFYRYLYMINIRKNDFVIVQQDWLRHKFIKLYKIKEAIVSYPEIKNVFSKNKEGAHRQQKDVFVFLYPALPRVFKNFEVICRSSEMLLKQGVSDFEVLLTISGDENYFSKYIYNSFKHIKNIKFLGLQSKEDLFKLYDEANCVIFPSKLETWGLPITEAKFFQKPLLLADLEYAHETVGTYDKVQFFDPDSPEQLAGAMKEMISGRAVFEKAETKAVPGPFARNWKELFDILLSGKE